MSMQAIQECEMCGKSLEQGNIYKIEEPDIVFHFCSPHCLKQWVNDAYSIIRVKIKLPDLNRDNYR